MNYINIKDINFEKLKQLNNFGTTSTLYRDNDKCIKILDSFSFKERKLMEEKLLLLSDLNIDGAVLPIDLIIKDGTLQGYTMDYIEGSISVYDKFMVAKLDTKELLQSLYKASITLREIHESGIVCQDLSFDNVIIDRESKIFFCDLDGCTYKDYSGSFISSILSNYMYDFKSREIYINQKSDKLSMLLWFYYLIFNKTIQEVKPDEYNELHDKIKTLQNLNRYIKSLINKKYPIVDIPYLDEVIDLTDDYIIDKVKKIHK